MPDRLRILGVIDHPSSLIGGAQISMAILLGRLIRRGHACLLAGPSARPERTRAYGADIRAVPDLEALRQVALDFKPHAIVSALAAGVPAAALAARHGIPHVVSVHSFEWCPPTPRERRQWRVADDRAYPSAAERKGVLGGASAILSNSRFIQARLRRRASAASVVVYPQFEAADVVLARDAVRDRRYVTAVCGYEYKGVEILLALADAMPQVEFQIVGRIVEPWRTLAAARPNVRLRAFAPPREFLAESRVVLVPSQWPEPFGRVAVEAMANGIPTIVSRTGGLTECGGRGAVLVHAFRSVAAWQRTLDAVLGDESSAWTIGAAGRHAAQRFFGDSGSSSVERLLRRAVAKARPRGPRGPLAIIAGDAGSRTAFAMINARWMEVRRGTRVEVISRDVRTADDVAADIQIRHDFSREFSAWRPPPFGHLVAVRTWDFGPYPRAWAEAITRDYDQLWVGTRWIRTQAIAAGIPAGRVKLVPFGVDTRTFTPRGPKFPLTGRPRFTLLFVGAPILRKGFDLLLRGYLAAFRRSDSVRLVIKANPDDVFYVGADLRDQIREAMRDAAAPEIVFVDRYLPAPDLASLYRAADVCVFPYRAEGFGLPILESMACARPVIVPRFGAALDFCSKQTSFFAPARRISLPVGRRMAFNTLGFAEDIEAVDFCEVDPLALAAVMQEAAAAPAHLLQSKARHSLRVARTFTWEASRAAAERAIAAALRRAVPVRCQRTRAESNRHARVLQAARDLYLGGSA